LPGAAAQQLFGPSYMQYPDYYTPKRTVRASCCTRQLVRPEPPDEDFAETFRCGSRRTPTGGRATPTGRAEEARVHGLADARAGRQADDRADAPKGRAAPDIRKTLRAHYERKRRIYGVEHPHFYDRDLRRLFSDRIEHAAI